MTECIDEIIKYVERLIDNGIGYVIDGSVYFSIDEYKNKGYQYPVLVNSNQASEQDFEDGEG